MRGSYKSSQRRVLVGSGYKIAIGVVVAIVVALVLTLLAVLPAVEDTITTERTIVSIENTTGGVGINSATDKIYVTVHYSNGTSEQVALSETTFEGLDLTTEGKKNVALSYGGFEQVVTFDVQDTLCTIKYESSVGGTVIGDVEQRIENGGSANTVIAVPESGFVFDEWNDGYPLPTRKDTGVNENKKYLAKFKKAEFTVRFYLPDGTVAVEEKVKFGNKATKAPIPPSEGNTGDPRMSLYGYTFVGWNPVDFSYIDRDLNIYPEYVKTATDVLMTVPTDVYGNAMGTVGVDPTGYYPHDKMATILATPYNSRKFSHWIITGVDGIEYRLDADGTATAPVGIAGQDLTFKSTRAGSAAEDYQLSFTPNADVSQIKIRAIFAYSQSDITFLNYQKSEDNGVEYHATNLPFGKPLSYVTGDIFSETDGMPVPGDVHGLQFIGWYEAGDPEQNLVDKDAMFEQPTTLVAKWKRRQYVIEFHAPNSAGVDEAFYTTTVTYQDALASGTNGGTPTTVPTKDKYVFIGWVDALTGDTVDDRTKIYYNEDYAVNSDFADGKIKVVPKWEPKSHVLNVVVNGSGTATLVVDEGKIDTEGNSLTEYVSVRGSITVYEDRTYTLEVKALVGNELISSTWKHGGATTVTNYEGTDNAIFDLNSTLVSDNDIVVNFAVKKVALDIYNGDGLYSGYVEYDGDTYVGSRETFSVDYNASMNLRVVSANPVYSIADITVNGVSYAEYLQRDTQEYTLTLSNVTKDTAVRITYTAIQYTVTVSEGEVFVTDIFDKSKESTFVSSGLTGGKNYAPEDKLALRVKTVADGKVLSRIRINGSLCDFYTPSFNDVFLHNWYINGVSADVEIEQINKEYYYVYGEVTYGPTVYVYGESLDGEPAVFTKVVSGENVIYTAVSENDATLYGNIKADLDIAERSIFSTSVVRDNRLTAVDILIDVSRDYNISIGYKDVAYTVSAHGDNGRISISSSTVGYAGSSVVKASPSAGYYVSGYIKNGAEYTVESGSKGEDFSLALNGIKEDVDITFLFEEITYGILFTHKNTALGEVSVDGKALNYSAQYDVAYHSSIEALITASEGYCITELKVIAGGVSTDRTVHYNMTEYVFAITDVTEKVVVEISTGTVDTAEATDAYTVDLSSIVGDATVSAEFLRCNYATANGIIVLANHGYTISGITVRTKDSATVLDSSVTAGGIGLEEYSFDIPDGTFASGEEVVVIVSTEPKQFSLTTVAEGEGTVSTGTTIFYGNRETVDINANRNCFISAFYVNGEEISIGGNNWSDLTTNETGAFTDGKYSFYPDKDMEIKVVFSRNTYKVTVDSSSINGTTTVSVIKNDESEEGAQDVPGIASGAKSDYAPHGWFVSVNMTADDGYHISALYINDVECALSFSIEDVNSHKMTAYVYKGGVQENKHVGTTERINVRVVYEINKYGFNYSINNVSDNFANDVNSGFLSASTLAGVGDNRYYGIEHGDNFSFTVTPSVSSGYYLKQIKIVYKSVYDSVKREIVHVPGDSALSDVTTRGGTVWFNRFIDSADGVTADIELVEVTYDRNEYLFTMNQASADYTGTMDVKFSHGSADVQYITIFDGEGNEYNYRDGIFYVDNGSGLTDSGITLVNEMNTYVFTDGEKNYEMFIEHGLRYTVFVNPNVGYERIGFSINGEDNLSRVADNRYSTNVDRTLDIEATYRVLTYDIKFDINVNDEDKTGKISADEIQNYADIYLVLLDGDIYYLDYKPVVGHDGVFALEYGKESITLSQDGAKYKLGYGARVQFVMYPKFDTTGYQLSSFVLSDTDITDLTTAMTVTVAGQPIEALVYGGRNVEEGYEVISDLIARTTFDVSRYNIHTEVVYADGVEGETVNYLKEESGLTIAWGDTADVKVEIGDGFILDRIFVKRGLGDTGHDVNLTTSADNPAFDEQMYYDRWNIQNNEYRDLLRVRKVGTDIYLTAYVNRQDYQIRYTVVGNSHLYDINTEYNGNHSGYPTYAESSRNNGDKDGQNKVVDGVWEGNVYVVEAYHFDEISTTVTPKNGYKIMPINTSATGERYEYKVIVRSVKFDTESLEWVAMKDNNGNEITTTLNFGVSSGDSRNFNFHPLTSPVASTYISSDIEVTIVIEVKRYDVQTSVGFTDAMGKDNANNTIVSWEVRDELGNGQSSVVLNRNNVIGNMTADHHGALSYTFTTPVGYRLRSLNVNGVVLSDIEQTGSYNAMNNTVSHRGSNVSYTITFNKTAYTYYYSILFNIDDALIKGAYGTPQESINVYMETAPIEYEIKTYVNGVHYENQLIDGRNGSTDGTTVTVYSPSSVQHFSTFTFTPSTYEGYTVKILDVMTGDSEGNYLDSTEFLTGSINLSKTYSANNTFMPAVDMLAGKTTIHILYGTGIVSYKVSLDAYGYSYGDGVEKKDEYGTVVSGSEGYIAYDTVMGKVTATVVTAGEDMHFSSGASYEYFSEVRLEGYALDGYVLYDVVEIVDGKEISVVDGVRNLSYFIENAGDLTKYTVRYAVDSLGDRHFKFVFKQRTTVTVNIPNPYKWIRGTTIGDMVYSSYVSLTARENGVVLTNKNADGDKVCDKYVYDVLVGNFVSFEYKDLYPKQGQTSSYFATYDGESEYVEEKLNANPLFGAGVGKVITNATELYLINEVQARVSFEKDTYGAISTSEGGTVSFNGSGNEPSGKYISNAYTLINKTLKITVKANENYVFSNMYVRQMDVEKSRIRGTIVYKEGSEEWLLYDESFAEKDTNGFTITKNGNDFEVVMRGDMELKFEFYRLYELNYGYDYTDKDVVYYSGESSFPITLDGERDNEYGDRYSLENGGKFFQYGSSFTLTAPAAHDNYVFVGWYLNDVNTYGSLDKILPTAGYLSRTFDLTEYLNGIIVNGNETDGLTFVAMYQPVISVAAINESFYYSADKDHWNSWQSGYLRTEYYDFDGYKVADTYTTNNLSNTVSTAIADLSYPDIEGVAGGDDRWNAAKYSGGKDTDRVYSAMHTFDILYQYIKNYDLVNNNWEDSYVTFSIEALPSGLKHLGWQYYNWNTSSYVDIGYSYADESYGIDPITGGITVVDNTFEIYSLSMTYLFSGEMPYAVSVSDGTNHVMDRPLIVRPNLHKVVGLEITQIAYMDTLNGEYTSEFSDIIHPTISNVTDSSLFYSLDDIRMTGEFDYGATANIRHYDKADGDGEDGIINYPILESGAIDMRYRFVGWRINWTVGGDTAYRFFSYEDGVAGFDMDLLYRFDDAPPSGNIQLQAVYIIQYRQNFYSYNVAGSEVSYDEAVSNGGYAVADAPKLSIESSLGSVNFATYNIDTGAVGNENIPFVMSRVSADDEHVLQYVMDVGCTYTVVSKNDEVIGDADAFSSGNDVAQGYDPEYDIFYKAYKNKNTIDEEEVDTIAYVGGTYTVEGIFSMDIQYLSTVNLTFNNMMFGSGVTLPEKFAEYYTDNRLTETTVWDDEYENVIDGTVEIKIDLVNVTNLHGVFNYSLRGFNDGNGIGATKALEYSYKATASSATMSNAGNLFNPTHESYRRYVVIDYNDEYIVGGSLVFGDSSYGGNIYDTANTGDGTEGKPYTIYTTAQLRNVGRFFYANDNTCNTVIPIDEFNNEIVQNHFRLENDISLQDYAGVTEVASPGRASSAWVPLCFTYNGGEGSDFGFDGVFDGGNNTLHKLAVYEADGDSNLTDINDPDNPLADFDYENLGGYGIFGLVSGGTIKNLNIGDSFVSMMSEEYASVGILAAKAYNAIFDNIKFVQSVNPTDRTSTSIDYTNDDGISKYMYTSAESMGMLAGRVYGGEVKNVVIEQAGHANIYLGSMGGAGEQSGVGLAIGYVYGNTNIDGITFIGSSDRYTKINDFTTYIPTGGLIGSVNGAQSISNLVISKVNMFIGSADAMSGIETVGGLIGKMTNGILKSSSVESGVSSSRTESITGTTAKGIVLHSSTNAGGMIGELNAGGIVDEIFGDSTKEYPDGVLGVVRMRGENVGGVVGRANDKSIVRNTRIKPTNGSSGDNGLRMMVDVRTNNSGNNNIGVLVGHAMGLVHDSAVIGEGTANRKTAYTNISNSVLYVYHSENTSYNSVGTISNSTNINEINNASVSIGGRVAAGGIVGTLEGQVYNSSFNGTRVTIRLDTKAGEMQPNGDRKNHTKITAGGIAGVVKGNSDANLIDGSGTGFYEEVIDIEGNKQIEYATRIQSCFANGGSIVVAQRIWVDSLPVTGTEQLMAPNSVTVAGIAGSIDGFMGAYGINSCYSVDCHFDTRIGAYGYTSYEEKDTVDMAESQQSADLGWAYGNKSIFGSGDAYTPVRSGLYVYGGIFGIVGGEFIDTNDPGKNNGCNYCWSKGNSVGEEYVTLNLSNVIQTDGPSIQRAIEFQTNEGNRSFSSTHGEGNVACSTGYVGADTEAMWITGMELFRSMEIGMTGRDGTPFEISKDATTRINVLFGAGFVGIYDSSVGGGNDGRIYRTDPETGRLLVSHSVNSLMDGTGWILDGEVRYDSYHDFLAVQSNWSKYLVADQPNVAIRNNA